MWHVSSRSGVTTLRTATHLLLTYLLLFPTTQHHTPATGSQQSDHRPLPAVESTAAVVVATVPSSDRHQWPPSSLQHPEPRQQTLAVGSGRRPDALHRTQVVQRRCRQSDRLAEFVVAFNQRLAPLLTLHRHTRLVAAVATSLPPPTESGRVYRQTEFCCLC